MIIFFMQVNKTYSMDNWHNDLKKVLKRAGADGKKVVFLFTDLQIKDESFLEDVSMILTTGDPRDKHTSSVIMRIFNRRGSKPLPRG